MEIILNTKKKCNKIFNEQIKRFRFRYNIFDDIQCGEFLQSELDAAV